MEKTPIFTFFKFRFSEVSLYNTCSIPHTGQAGSEVAQRHWAAALPDVQHGPPAVHGAVVHRQHRQRLPEAVVGRPEDGPLVPCVGPAGLATTVHECRHSVVRWMVYNLGNEIGF